jgi:hypothetical protein
MFDNMMNKFVWGHMNQSGVLMDHFNIRMLSMTGMRANFARLADALTTEGKIDSSVKVLDRCMYLTPKKQVPYDSDIIDIINGYYKTKHTEKANIMLNDYADDCTAELDYYFSLSNRWKDAAIYEREESLFTNLQHNMGKKT